MSSGSSTALRVIDFGVKFAKMFGGLRKQGAHKAENFTA